MKNNQAVSIGERLREERIRLDLNQTEFGQLAGVTKKTQGLYEGGQRYPNAQYLLAIAMGGADVMYILTGERGGGPFTPRKKALLDAYDASPEEGKRIIESTAHFAAEPKR